MTLSTRRDSNPKAYLANMNGVITIRNPIACEEMYRATLFETLYLKLIFANVNDWFRKKTTSIDAAREKVLAANGNTSDSPY